jgi:hypothetical protein
VNGVERCGEVAECDREGGVRVGRERRKRVYQGATPRLVARPLPLLQPNGGEKRIAAVAPTPATPSSTREERMSETRPKL